MWNQKSVLFPLYSPVCFLPSFGDLIGGTAVDTVSAGLSRFRLSQTFAPLFLSHYLSLFSFQNDTHSLLQLLA